MKESQLERRRQPTCPQTSSRDLSAQRKVDGRTVTRVRWQPLASGHFLGCHSFGEQTITVPNHLVRRHWRAVLKVFFIYT